MSKAKAIGVAAFAFATWAHAQTPLVSMPNFCTEAARTGRPHFYPDRARQRDLAGAVTLDCLLADDNTLSTCQVIDETPAGVGFDQSALRIACNWDPQVAAENLRAEDNRHVRRTFRFERPDPPSRRERGSITNR